MFFMRKTTALPSAAEALPGRATPIPTATIHFVNGHGLQPPYPADLEQARTFFDRYTWRARCPADDLHAAEVAA